MPIASHKIKSMVDVRAEAIRSHMLSCIYIYISNFYINISEYFCCECVLCSVNTPIPYYDSIIWKKRIRRNNDNNSHTHTHYTPHKAHRRRRRTRAHSHRRNGSKGWWITLTEVNLEFFFACHCLHKINTICENGKRKAKHVANRRRRRTREHTHIQNFVCASRHAPACEELVSYSYIVFTYVCIVYR